MKPIQFLINGYGQVTFWLWNLLFVLTVYFGILPFVGLPILQATVAGQISWTFTVSLLIVLGVPLICLGVGVRLVRRPLALLRLFYGVEAPLVILALVRLVALRELTPASQLILGTIGISILSFAVYLTRGLWPGQRGAMVQLVLHTLMLLTGVYAGAVLLFFALPVALWFLQGLVTLAWVRPLWDALNPAHWSWAMWYAPLGLMLFGLTVSVFVVTPSSWASLYVLAGWDALKRVSHQYGRRWAIATTAGTLTAWLVLFLAVLPQPQGHAFALLQTPPANSAAQQALLAQSAAIRKGLLNAYLHDYRYFSTRHQSNSLRSLYANYLPEAGTEWVQARFNDLLSPFLYQGEVGDGDRAAKLYADFFDQPIQKAEQGPISHALNNTGYRDEAKAGLLNLNQRRVLLANQDVTVTEKGDWATVELHEVYKNQTNDVQEVFYSFSLPESAVITGVWLGDTADLARRFNFQVSPRGAAQQVYNAQVQRANPIDPALLEQVGPRHYRLRAFPVPPQIPTWATRNPRAVNGPAPAPAPTEMHLWLTYQVMRTDQGWPLPQLGETRNLFWSAKTQRFLAGQPVPQALRWDNQWLPTVLPAQTQASAQSHTITLADQRVVARPLTAREYRLPQGQRFAIVLDTSRSMGAHGEALRSQLQWLQAHGFADHQLSNNDADLFLTSATTAPTRLDDLRQFNPNKTVFYGKLQLQTMLDQFEQLHGKTAYDSVIVVTDGDTYELSNDSGKVSAAVPLWMVHLGQLPPAYEDKIIEVMQSSRGGVGTSIAEVLQRGATQAALGAPVVTVVDGYAWSVQPLMAAKPTGAIGKPTLQMPSPSPIQTSEPAFIPLAARQVVLALSRQWEGAELSVAHLDSIHAIAKQTKIVTPYSSMIVLVNDEQRRQLAEAELTSDRFHREVETGSEALEKPDNLLSTSVPEPSPLLGLGLAGLVLWGWQRRSVGVSVRE